MSEQEQPWVFQSGIRAQLRSLYAIKTYSINHVKTRFSGNFISMKYVRNRQYLRRARNNNANHQDNHHAQPIYPTWAFIPSQRDRRNGFTSNSLGQEFISIYKRSGIDAATSHSGRRTFITNLANKGVSARVLMALAGHRNLSTTQRYIDVNDDLKRVAVNLL
jgi:site-specific recombinase XerD